MPTAMAEPASIRPSPPNAAPSAALRPTRTRYWLVVFAVALAIIQYIDKVCISQAAPFIEKDLHLSDDQMGWVFGAFTLAYALFEIPAGYLGDRFGPRRVLLRIVIWWSFCTAALGRMWSGGSLIVTQFLFGAGEAGAFPNLTKTFNRWLPLRERSRAQGIMWMSARLGGAFTPLLVYLCLQHVTWRTAFLLFGLPGVIWAILFFRWYRDDPRAHPRVNAAEAALMPVEAGSGRALQGAVEETVHVANGLVPVRAIFRVQLLLLVLHHLVPDLPAQGARVRFEAQRAAGRHAAVRGRGGVAVRRLDFPDPQPAVGWRGQSPAGYWRSRGFRRRGIARGADMADESVSGGGRHCPGGLLQRHPIARRLDRLHGRGRQGGGNPLRHDEHDGQRGRVCLTHRLRLHRQAYRQLELGVLCHGGGLCAGRLLLAGDGPRDATGGTGKAHWLRHALREGSRRGLVEV